MKNLSSKSDWDADQVRKFLEQSVIPVRIAVLDEGYPLICSVWFEYDADALVCVSHKDSKLAQLLQSEGRCGFEVAPNEPPYRGVRGKADITVHQGNQVEARLRRLIERYLGDSNEDLGKWLLSRVDEELEFHLHPAWVTAWDYGGRMETVD